MKDNTRPSTGSSSPRSDRLRAFTGLEWAVGLAVLGILAITLAVSVLALT